MLLLEVEDLADVRHMPWRLFWKPRRPPLEAIAYQDTNKMNGNQGGDDS
jgi:hypothetical protein